MAAGMTTSSGDGGSPAAAEVYDNLVEMRERAVMLQTVLQGTSSPAVDAGKLMEGMMASLSSALSMLNAGVGSSVAPPSGASRPRRRRSGPVAGGPHRRSTSRRRSKSPLFKTVKAATLNDGHSWRKYGQKRIQEYTNERSYYRCTHKPEQGCMATRQVQQSDTNPSEFIINYFGKHTCRDLSTIPLVIDDGAAAALLPPLDCANLISFSSSSTAIGAGGGRPFDHSAVKEPMDYYPMLFSCCFDDGSPPALQECASGCTLSSSLQTPGRLIGAAAPGSTSTLTVGSAPAEYYWNSAVGIGAGVDMAGSGGGTSSFPSSPSSLGFMTASPAFGSFGDDDLFGFDS